MTFEITAEWVRKVINTKHSNYQNNVDLSKKLRVHADGEIPTELIECRRPSESEEIKDYRKKIYVPKTKNPIQKVLNSLEKIRRSEDWSIQYDSSKIPSSIAENETLERYCEINYPVHTSLTNWCFSELLKQYLLDANSIVAVIPEKQPENTNEYTKPIAVVFDSRQIIDFQEGEYYVLLSNDTSTYTTPAGLKTKTDGKIYYIITDTKVLKYEQKGSSGDLILTLDYEHNFGSIPAFKVGGLFHKRKNNETIYDSRISSMIPSLDEAAREYSDLQAEILQHIHSEKYIYTNTECPSCAGTGKLNIRNADGTYQTCTSCGGIGKLAGVSPYGVHLIDAAKAGELQVPTPPVGYVQKTADIAKLQDERVRQHIYDALSTLNMEFLAETPLNQSGMAKEVDKDELNNFVNSIAEDLIRILDNIYAYICEYRYSVVVQDKEKRKDLLPRINVPTKYDLLNSNSLMNEITAAKSANVNPVIIRTMEIEFAKKKFNTNPEISYEAQAVFELDPLYGLSDDDKMTRLSNGGITELDYIISCNIVQFVRKAVEDNEDFYGIKPAEKRKLIQKYAEAIKQDNNNDQLKIKVEPTV